MARLLEEDVVKFKCNSTPSLISLCLAGLYKEDNILAMTIFHLDKNPESREENVIIKPEKLPSKNNPEKVQKNIPEKVQKNIPEKVQKNIPEKVQKNVPEKNQKTVPEDGQKTVAEKAPKQSVQNKQSASSVPSNAGKKAQEKKACTPSSLKDSVL